MSHPQSMQSPRAGQESASQFNLSDPDVRVSTQYVTLCDWKLHLCRAPTAFLKQS